MAPFLGKANVFVEILLMLSRKILIQDREWKIVRWNKFFMPRGHNLSIKFCRYSLGIVQGYIVAVHQFVVLVWTWCPGKIVVCTAQTSKPTYLITH